MISSHQNTAVSLSLTHTAHSNIHTGTYGEKHFGLSHLMTLSFSFFGLMMPMAGEGQLLMGSSLPFIRLLLSAYGCTVLLLDSRGFRVGTLRVGDEEERTVIGYVDFWKNSSGHKN